MNEETQNIIVEGQSVNYIKLMKNTKGYNWEIKVLSLDIVELDRLNKIMMDRFGSTV